MLPDTVRAAHSCFQLRSLVWRGAASSLQRDRVGEGGTEVTCRHQEGLVAVPVKGMRSQGD